jgi:predicted nuclease with RNAse H fold
MLVGLDFAFSMPAWFVRDVLKVVDVRGVWDVVEAEAERWLEGSAPSPFWGRGEQRYRPQLPARRAYRLTERDLARLAGVRPSSVFQLTGAGQVGPGSLRGMPILRALQSEGFAIWPFDAFALPLVVEIYPRVLTGPVNKRSLAARRAHLEAEGVRDPQVAEQATSSEHAFDAACSALVLSRQVGQLRTLNREDFPYDVEGKIWAPGVYVERVCASACSPAAVTARA